MRKGKMAAQAAHASMKAILDLLEISHIDGKNEVVKLEGVFVEDGPVWDWLNGIFTKIVVGVNSETELLEIYKKCEEINLPIPHALICDVGKTEFGGKPTNTAVAVGPWWEDIIDMITGGLKLL